MKEKGTVAPVGLDTETSHCQAGSAPELSDLGLGRVSAGGHVLPSAHLEEVKLRLWKQHAAHQGRPVLL